MVRNSLAIYVILSLYFTVLAGTNDTKAIHWESAKSLAGYMPEAVLRSGSRVESLDNSSACSGQFISNRGLYLTAQHCVMRSILNEGPQLTYNTGNIKPFYKGWFVRDSSKLPFQTQEIQDARWLRAQGETTEPVVMALGRGYFEYPPDIRTMEEFEFIQAKAAEFSLYQEDFAILKFNLQKPETHSCIQLSDQDPVSGDDAWAVGFPENLAMSGRAPQKFVLKAKIFPTISALKVSRGEIVIYPEESWFDSNRLFLLSGKVLAGMSGGAVLNSEGHIIGIIIAQLSSNDAIVLKSSFISRELKKKFGEKELKVNYTCKK